MKKGIKGENKKGKRMGELNERKRKYKKSEVRRRKDIERTEE